ncbi:MAG: glycogen synthase GlgA [Candidatus Methylomirabilales bacterium]
MKIAFVTPEAAPFAKTGGLGDVAGSLPRTLAKRGHEVLLFLPKYHAVPLDHYSLRERPETIQVPVGAQTEVGTLWEGEVGRVRVILLGHDGYYDRPGLYQQEGQDYPDNAERFIFLSRGTLEALRVLDCTPDVIHVNDWQTALVPAYLKTRYRGDARLGRVPSALTLHNLGYQGLFPTNTFSITGLPAAVMGPRGIEFWGRVNFLKAGLVYADALTTVSVRHAQEIQTPEFGYGLDAILGRRAADLTGILNGVDYGEWHPARDPHLVANYSVEDLTGKAACKRDLQRILALPERPEVPILAVVSRLVYQKGIDLVARIMPDLLQHDVQCVLLGTGEVALEQTFQRLAKKAEKRLAVRIGFDEVLSHKIEGGADLFLMPSRYEPCGLNQMYSLAYGTIPVVRATGGLDDTITSFDPITGTGNGFKTQHADAEELLRTIRQAVALFKQQEIWLRLMQNAMRADFSWDRSAAAYEEVYESL